MDLPAKVRAIVGRFVRLNPWIGWQEFEQEAAVALAMAKPQYVEQCPEVVVRRQLWLHVLERRSPLRARCGKYNRPTEAVAVGLDKVVELTTGNNIEWRMDLERASAVVRELLKREPEAAQRVLLHDEKPAEVAQRLGMDRSEVYEQTKQARLSLLRSQRLRQMVAELYV